MKQLQPILKQTGLTRLFGNGANYKKNDLVRMMADYFRKVRAFKKPAPDQKQARDWLLDAMAFPAIAPDKVAHQPEEAAAPEPEEEELAKAA